MEQAKFTYSPLGKVFEKQRKMIEEQSKEENKQMLLEIETKDQLFWPIKMIKKIIIKMYLKNCFKKDLIK